MYTPDQIAKDISGAPEISIEYYFTRSLLDGMFMEFGVAQGDSIKVIAECNPDKVIYGFDWFRGLPERWGTLPVGHFACAVPDDLPPNVELVVGLFRTTLPEFLRVIPGYVAFAHVDSDIYSSAKCVLDNLKPRLTTGSVLAFDEIWGHENFRDHEAKAFAEFLNETGFTYYCIGRYGSDKAGFRLFAP